METGLLNPKSGVASTTALEALKRITSSVHISASTDPLASLKALSVASTSNEHDEETVKLIVDLNRRKGATVASLTGHIVGLQVAKQISSGNLPLYVTKGGVLLGLAKRVPAILAQLIGDQSGELPCYIKQAQVLDDNDRLGIWITNKSCAASEQVLVSWSDYWASRSMTVYSKSNEGS